MSDMTAAILQVLVGVLGWGLIAAVFVVFVKRLHLTQDIEAWTDAFIAEVCDVADTERGLPDMRDKRR